MTRGFVRNDIGGEMAVVTKHIKLNTKGRTDIIDITEKIQAELSGLEILKGTVTVFSVGSTGAITTIEFEPALVADMKRFFEEIIPSKREYEHDKTWGDANGYSHLRASLVGPSLTVPFDDGKLCLGTWQQVVFVDFDNRPRSRNIVLQFIGE
jgi:secondary thiamine-phosphate synthase enzyme